jgi:hypothetical protein
MLVWIVYDVPRDCEGAPDVQSYLDRLRRGLAAASVHEGLPRGGVGLWLRLSEQGELLDASPTESTDPHTFAALSAALADLSPFGPPPADLRDCLVDQPILLQTVVP